MDDLIALLLGQSVATVTAADLPSWWQGTSTLRARFPAPIDRAMAQGFVADRAGFAFAAGYEAAIHALVPELPAEALASLCVTEESGNHPRSIRTRLELRGDEGVVSGSKRWSTMAPLADVLIVIALEGVREDGRPSLRAVRLDPGGPGVSVRPMPETPFVPEVPHAELTFEDARVPASAVLPGDGYVAYTKAFRTVEDLHVTAAVLGYGLSVAVRYGLPEPLRERAFFLCIAARALAGFPAGRPETHVILSGWLAEVAGLWADLEPHFSQVGDAERERWYRDRALVQVASKARERRREKAWQSLRREGG